MSVEYKPIGSTSGAITASTKIRTSASTQDGYTDAEIQHVKLDTGDGTNTQPISGTVSANPTASTISSGSRASGDGVGDLISVDCTNYRSVSVQLTGTWTGTVSFQGSNDNSTWYNAYGQNVNTLAQVAAVTANGLYLFGLGYAYFRVRFTTATSGTVACTAYFNQTVINPPASLVTLGFGATQPLKVEDAAHASGDYGIMSLSVRKDAAAALAGADGDYAPLEVDANGRLWVTPAESTAPTLYNITLTLADTEYSQALPAGTRSIRFMARTAAAVRFAFVTGKVATPTAPYMTLPASSGYAQEHIYLASTTIYFASSSAGTVVELEVWA